jgi:hypothetical protein
MMSVKKSVSFDLSVNSVKEVLHREDLTSEEKSAVWLRRSEYAAIQIDYKITATKIIRGNTFEENDYETRRGLEGWSPTASLRRDRIVHSALDAVLQEQEFQKFDSVNDPERIAEVYAEDTRRSRDAARTLGRKDEEEAKAIVSWVPVSKPTIKTVENKMRKRPSMTDHVKSFVRVLRLR